MTVLPVVARELRVASRRRGTYWLRFSTGLLAIALGSWLWLVLLPHIPSSQRGPMLFHNIAGLAFLYALVCGTIVTSDSLSEEKREGTLGLLFLTDLKAYDIVAGKLAATSLNAFYRLLAVFPVMAIPILMGGVTPGEFWRMVLVLVNTMFLSLSLGVMASAFCRRQRQAASVTMVLLLAIAALLPALGLLISVRRNLPTVPLQFLLPSPGFAFAGALDSLHRTVQRPFWISTAATHALAWCSLILACLSLPHAWQDRPAGARWVRWRERWLRWAFGKPLARLAFRRRLLNINAYFWLGARNRLKPYFLLGFLGLAGALWLWLSFKYPDPMLDPPTYITTAILLHSLLKFSLASEAARILADDRRAGSLELVLCTPLSIHDILKGHFLALRRQFAAGIAIVLAADLAMFIGGIHDVFGRDATKEWFLVFTVGTLMFLADLFTLAWIGPWLGLTAKKAQYASSGALARVLVLPWIIFLLFCTLLALAEPRNFNPRPSFFMCVWFIVGILNNIAWFSIARTNLYRRFRTVAAQRFQPKTRRWPFFNKSPAMNPVVGLPQT